MNGQGGEMEDEYAFNYPGMVEYSAPVDVEATLNSLLASSPSESYDFSASLLSSSSSVRTSTHFNAIPLRSSLTNNAINTTTNIVNNNANVNNFNYNTTPIVALNNSGIPLLPPPHAPSSHPLFRETPSPPVTPNPTTQVDKRKRRRKDDVLPDEVCRGFDWAVYQSPQVSYLVYDALTAQPLGDTLDVIIYKSGTNTHFSTSEKAWISYRQNQFKIICLLKMPQPNVPMFLRDGAMDAELKQFFVKLYAIKSTPMGITDEIQVGLCHAGKSRVKKEKTEIVPIPIIDGKAEFANLQFERSNVTKGQQEYFHLVVTVYAKTSNSFYPIMSRISPRIIVRSQHPGFYGPPSPEQPSEPTSLSTYATSSEEGLSPKTFENDPTWHQSGDAVFRMGKVGVNTSDPTEALTVHGNALVTGNLFKPSDRRIKSDFVSVDPSEQLENIRNLKIYDYKIKERSERGVIAQELQAVMPPAVHEAGDVTIDGITVPNLLVVNERSLLYENIGATQQLDKHLQIEKTTIIQIDSKVDDLQKTVEKDKAELQDQIKSVSGLFFAEETPKGEMAQAWKEEQVAFGINLFRMGPARSFMVLGYFVGYLWLLGALYVFSNIPSRKVLGRACIIKFAVWYSLYKWILGAEHHDIALYVYWTIGATLLIGNWRRNKRRIEAKREGREEEEDVRPGTGWRFWERLVMRHASIEEESFLARDRKRDRKKQKKKNQRDRDFIPEEEGRVREGEIRF